TGITLHSGDIFQVHMVYDGTNLSVTITDTATNASVSQIYAVDIPQTVGGTTGFVGFTAGTGALTATQDILNWTFVPGTESYPLSDSVAAAMVVLAPSFEPRPQNYPANTSIPSSGELALVGILSFLDSHS